MTIYRKNTQAFSETEIDGEIVLMQLETGDFFSITETGVDIWRLIDGNRSAKAMAAELIDAFDGHADQIARDIADYLDQLMQSGFLVKAAA